MLEQKVHNDAIKPSRIDGEIEAMAVLGLDVRLEIRRAAEISIEGLVNDARTVAAARGEVVFACYDQGGTLEIRCIVAYKGGREREKLANGERLLGGLDKGGNGAVVGSCFKVWLNDPENVGRRDVAAVKYGEGTGPLQACDPWRECFEQDLRVRSVECVPGQNGGVGNVRVARYQCI